MVGKLQWLVGNGTGNGNGNGNGKSGIRSSGTQ